MSGRGMGGEWGWITRARNRESGGDDSEIKSMSGGEIIKSRTNIDANVTHDLGKKRRATDHYVFE